MKENIANVEAALKDYKAMTAPPTCKIHYQFGKRVPKHKLNPMARSIVEVNS